MHLLIAAAGSGRRMGATRNKLLLPLSGQPVLAWTLQAALDAETIHWVGIIGQEIDRSEILDLVQGAPKPVAWIAGGDSRQESVERGLAGLTVFPRRTRRKGAAAAAATAAAASQRERESTAG